jgi:hypothetical protein
VHQVGHYPELHQDARSTKHKKSPSPVKKKISVFRFTASLDMTP